MIRFAFGEVIPPDIWEGEWKGTRWEAGRWTLLLPYKKQTTSA